MKLVLPNERPVSLNSYYAGMHWTKRKAEADRVHWLVYAAVVTAKAVVFKKRVDIVVTAYFKNRQQDASNIMGKMYEDGLKGRVIVDDTPQYVRSMKTVSEVDKEKPRVEIEITEIEDEK